MSVRTLGSSFRLMRLKGACNCHMEHLLARVYGTLLTYVGTSYRDDGTIMTSATVPTQIQAAFSTVCPRITVRRLLPYSPIHTDPSAAKGLLHRQFSLVLRAPGTYTYSDSDHRTFLLFTACAPSLHPLPHRRSASLKNIDRRSASLKNIDRRSASLKNFSCLAVELHRLRR
jgi:hypothetical protein